MNTEQMKNLNELCFDDEDVQRNRNILVSEMKDSESHFIEVWDNSTGEIALVRMPECERVSNSTSSESVNLLNIEILHVTADSNEAISDLAQRLCKAFETDLDELRAMAEYECMTPGMKWVADLSAEDRDMLGLAAHYFPDIDSELVDQVDSGRIPDSLLEFLKDEIARVIRTALFDDYPHILLDHLRLGDDFGFSEIKEAIDVLSFDMEDIIQRASSSKIRPESYKS